MKETWKAAKVGVFVVVALVATYLSYRLIEERRAGAEGYRVWAIFDDAQGLADKSRVLVAGIQVGYIESIRLWGSRARVDLHMEKEVKLYTDASIAKRSASILGESILVIDPGTRGREVLRDGMRLNTAPEAGGTDQIMANVAEATKSIKAVAAQLERVFGSPEGGALMSSSLQNLAQALEGINRTIQQNEEIINRTLANVEMTTEEGGPRLVHALENIETITENVRQIVADNRAGVNHAVGEVDETIASIHQAADQLNQVLADVGQVTGRTARGEGTVGRLTSDDGLIDEVQGVAEGIGDIVGGVSRLQTIVSLRSEYNFLANTFKSYVSLRLQPGEDRYYLLELINDPRGLTSFTRTTVSTSPPMDGVPQNYQETRVETRDAFRFSILFAKRIYFVTGRFGILESTGGLGIDLHFLDNRLEISTDLFAFGEKSLPRLRMKAALEFVRRAWLLAGVDDALNSDSTDVFVGLMLRFNDEDLKSILPFTGGLSTGT